MARATAIELSEVENFLFGAGLGPEIGREFAEIRDPIMERFTRELELPMAPRYFYQIWELAGRKLDNRTELRSSESARLKAFEQKLRDLGARTREMDLDQFFRAMGLCIAA